MFKNLADIFVHKWWIQSNFFWWKYSIFSKLFTISWVVKKKSSPTAAVIVAFTVFEIKKTTNFMKLEYISYTMTLDYKKKIKMQQNGGFLKKKLKFCWKIWWFLAWKNYVFHSIIKLEGHCIEKQTHNKLRKDSSRSDNLLSSYSCSKFEKCGFEKHAFKDKSRQSANNNWGTAVK